MICFDFLEMHDKSKISKRGHNALIYLMTSTSTSVCHPVAVVVAVLPVRVDVRLAVIVVAVTLFSCC